jgi:hypothetical protein
VEWRHVRLIEGDSGWELTPKIDGYDAVIDRLNQSNDHEENERLSDLLDALGSAGWELVQVERLTDDEDSLWYARYYFKRQIGTPPNEWRHF